MEAIPKKKGRKWLFFGYVIVVLAVTASLFAWKSGIMNQNHFPLQNKAQGFIQGAFQKGQNITQGAIQKGSDLFSGNIHNQTPNGQAFNGQVPNSQSGFDQGRMKYGQDFGGQQGAMMGGHHGFDGHRRGHGHDFGFVGFFIGIGGLLLALVGLYVRRTKKWLGNVMIVAGVLPILPVVLVGTLVYWLVKKVRSGKKIPVTATFSFQSDYSANGEFLDEWERANKKEDK